MEIHWSSMTIVLLQHNQIEEESLVLEVILKTELVLCLAHLSQYIRFFLGRGRD